MLQILSAFASYVNVPAAHVEDRSAVAPLEVAAGERSHEVVRIHSGSEEPANADAAIRYRDRWFWIDNSDWQTKRALTAVMFFFTLAGTGSGENLPLVTIPAQ
jgi:hypothetical protein